MTTVLRIGYGLWCWLVFALAALLALLVGVPAPRLAWRRHVVRGVDVFDDDSAGAHGVALCCPQGSDCGCGNYIQVVKTQIKKSLLEWG